MNSSYKNLGNFFHILNQIPFGGNVGSVIDDLSFKVNEVLTSGSLSGADSEILDLNFLLQKIADSIDAESVESKKSKDFNTSDSGVIYISEIPNCTVDIEKDPIFKEVVDLFIQSDKNLNITFNDVLNCKLIYAKFLKFFYNELYFGDKIEIKKSDENKKNLAVAILEFELRHGFVTSNVEMLYDDVFKNIYEPLGYDKQDVVVKIELYGFLKAYHMMKEAFCGINRRRKDSNGEYERAFDHSRETVKIIVNEFPFTNRVKTIAGLLHDSIEDIEEITYEILFNEFGAEIANVVLNVTKKDRRIYLNFSEREKIALIEKGKTKKVLKKELQNNQEYLLLVNKGKQMRNDEYFGNIFHANEDIFYVKLADRLHNLRTMEDEDIEKIVNKIIETERFIYNLASTEKKRIQNIEEEENIDIMKEKKHPYDLIVYQVDRLKRNPQVLELYKQSVLESTFIISN